MTWWESKKRDMAFNTIWGVATLLALAGVHYVWPVHSWSWGLLLGAGVGASTVLLSSILISYSRLSEWFEDGRRQA